MQQIVREPTRGDYLLDLVISNVEALKCKVLSNIADHCLVSACFDLPVPVSINQDRIVWQFPKADWDDLRAKIVDNDWSNLEASSADVGAEFFTSEV